MRSFAALALFSCAVFAQQSAETYYSVPLIDAPELAARGSHAVGVRTFTITNPDQPDILQFDKATGKAPLTPRALTIELWYPAVIPAGQREHTTYQSVLTPRGGAPIPYTTVGKALRDAPPKTGERYPLVIVSHGYPGSRVFLTWLTENLASKGYVVAAIDHTDSVTGAVRGFASTLLNRAADQHFTIDALAAMERQENHVLHGIMDAGRVAIVGYSMGGYGALAASGAGYSKQGGSARVVPGGYFDDWTAGSPKYDARPRGHIKAVVAIAPWGAQPPHNNWDAAGLAGLRIPSLFIVGNQDDVSGYEQGVKRAYDGAVRSNRCLLVFENARHNVGGNPAPSEARAAFPTLESFEEPVWRKERITSINQHFITAFLDLNLKGDETRRAYLNVAVPRSNDGKDATLWKGFQKRWALGLELHCAPPAAQ